MTEDELAPVLGHFWCSQDVWRCICGKENNKGVLLSENKNKGTVQTIQSVGHE